MKAKHLWTLWILFKRGHSMYLAFLVSFLNFITIQYTLLISRIPTLKAIFSNLLLFTSLFLALYVPVAVILGYIDYRRGGVETMQQLNPWVNDLSSALILIAEGRVEEAKRILERWKR